MKHMPVLSSFVAYGIPIVWRVYICLSIHQLLDIWIVHIFGLNAVNIHGYVLVWTYVFIYFS